MFRRMLVAIVVATPLILSPLVAEDSPIVSDARLFPDSSVVYVELPRPADLVALVFDHPLREKIEAMPPYQTAIQSPQYKRFVFGRGMVETQLQMSWRQALDTFFANRVSLVLDAKTQGAAVVVHGKDAASMELFSDTFLEFAKEGPNAGNIKEGEYRGVQAYQIDNLRYGVYQDRLVITNNSDLGKSIIDHLIEGGPSLEDNPRFQAALQTRPSGLAGWAFIDLEFIRNANVARPVFEDQINNPVGELLIGGIQSALQQTPYATASLFADTGAVAIQLGLPFDAKWIPEHREYFFGPAASGRGPTLPATDQTLFTLSTYRDFSEMWLRAGDLFDAEINDGFAQADTNLSTLFAGRDFGEDILGSFHSEVGLVATRQDFTDVLPRPTIQLPALAVVFRLKDPEPMTRELRRIFQSLVGFLNVVGAMNGQNQLEMDMEKIGDHAELVTSTFVPEEDDRESTDAEILFNFSPSVGFAGERFVVSSSKALARQLTLAKQPEQTHIADNTRIRLHAPVLRNVLEDNRQQLVAQNMLEEGNTKEEAEAVIDLLLQVVGYFHQASLRLGSTDDFLEAEFKLQVWQ